MFVCSVDSPIFSSPQQSGTSGSTGSGAGVSGTWRNSILQNYRKKFRKDLIINNEVNFCKTGLLLSQSEHGYPDDTIGVAGDDDVLRVPLVHLRHAAAQDLLAASCEGVGAGDGAAVNAPHVDVGSCTGDDVPLYKHKHTQLLFTALE